MTEDIKDQIAEIRRELQEIKVLVEFLNKDLAFLEKIITNL